VPEFRKTLRADDRLFTVRVECQPKTATATRRPPPAQHGETFQPRGLNPHVGKGSLEVRGTFCLLFDPAQSVVILVLDRPSAKRTKIRSVRRALSESCQPPTDKILTIPDRTATDPQFDGPPNERRRVRQASSGPVSCSATRHPRRPRS
jgi:hypothetical protein